MTRVATILILTLTFAAAIPLRAQDWPLPAATPNTDSACTGCLNGKDGLKTIGYPPTLRFVGRFVDSELTNEIQFFFRTARARGVVFSDATNRTYMLIGSAVAAYNADALLTRLTAHERMQVATAIPTRPFNARTPLQNELFLYWDRWFYAEQSEPAWNLGGGDGQDRLYGIDADDRGYVYMAYSTFGWGIARDDFGTGGDKMPSVFQFVPGASDVTPKLIVSCKVNGDYFAVVTTGNASEAQVWNVTNPVAPAKVADLPGRAFQSFAKDVAGDRIATVDGNGRLQILTTSAFVNGGAPLISRTLPGGQYHNITTDGTNFYVQSSIAGSEYISIINGSTYAETQFPIMTANGTPVSMESDGIRAGAGFVAVWGIEAAAGGWNARLYKSGNGGTLSEVPLDNYFAKYYSGGSPAGYAHPSSSALFDVAPYKKSGKVYLIVESFGLGDIYEIKSGDSLTAKLVNPATPVYGDRLTFSVTSSSGAPLNAKWDFGDGTTSVTSASTVTHQYGGATATDLPLTRHTTVTSQADASVTDSLAVTLANPKVASVNVAALNSSAFDQIVTGDQFADASPGNPESHYFTWTNDGATTKHLPSDAVPVGACGNHTFTVAAHYGPYDPATFTGSADASFSLGPQPYTARPFAASIQGPASGSTESAIFTATVRATQLAADLPNGPATGCAYEWDLVDSANANRFQSKGSATLGTIPAFTVAHSQFNATGMRIVLHVSVASNAVSSTCNAAGLTTETVTSATLNGPDPAITVTGCVHVGEPCTLSASSASGGSQSGWTYDWSTSGPAQCIHCGVSDSLSPSFTAPGTYTATLTVSNAVGSATVQSSPITVGAPPCEAPRETNTAIGFSGPTSGCFSSFDTCAAGEAITFHISTFGWSISDCDTYLWNFGDGTQSTDAQPTHVYLTNGQRAVSLAITGGGVTGRVTTTIAIGKTVPKTCPTMFPDSNVYIKWLGTASQCFLPDTSCTAGETIGFTAASLGYDFSCATHTFAWDFGDGSKSTDQNPSHVFAKDGTYRVTLHVSNPTQSVDLVGSVKVGSGVVILPRRHPMAHH